MYSKGNYKQGEKITLRMEENNSKWSKWHRINLQNIQATLAAQYQRNNPIKKQAEHLNRHFFPKKMYRWAINTWKDAQHSSLLEKCNSNYNELSPHTSQDGHHKTVYQYYKQDWRKSERETQHLYINIYIPMNLFAGQQLRCKHREQTCGHGEGRRQRDDLKESHWNIYTTMCEINSQCEFSVRCRKL